ncbi:MAG: 4Fe-4S binding protein [Oscillospiraceae bacterium]
MAESDPEKCVACGKCVETCPAGAVRLGQKLCTKEGPIQYPHHELPDDTRVGRGSLEQELPQRERMHPDLADRHGALQGCLPGTHRHPGLHQDGGRRPLCRRAQAHQEG